MDTYNIVKRIRNEQSVYAAISAQHQDTCYHINTSVPLKPIWYEIYLVTKPSNNTECPSKHSYTHKSTLGLKGTHAMCHYRCFSYKTTTIKLLLWSHLIAVMTSYLTLSHLFMPWKPFQNSGIAAKQVTVVRFKSHFIWTHVS